MHRAKPNKQYIYKLRDKKNNMKMESGSHIERYNRENALKCNIVETL